MRMAVGLWLVLWFFLSAAAAERMTSAIIDGKSLTHIQDVHLVSGGRLVILYPDGGITVAADKVPAQFLDSWGITQAQVADSKKAFERESEESLNQAISAGLFREVEGVVYDLRKAQPGWVRFSEARVLQVFDDGALLDPAPDQAASAIVYVRNLPNKILSDNDRLTVYACLAGRVTLESRLGIQRTIRCYDAGRVCARNQIPEAILKEGKPLAALSVALRPKEPHAPLPARDRIRVVGSGFFITEDGYLLTNYHVVQNAEKVQVQYGGRVFPAQVLEVDKVNDVAVVKVSGTNFHALALSRKASAELGQPVFTIGFPNIDVQGIEPKYTDGKISSLTGLQDDPSQYQISVPVQPGNSGGPLCDTNGTVVGIIVAQLSDMALLHSSGSLPQNVNYAVKTKFALNLLQRLPKAALPRETASPVNSASGPVRLVEESVAMVFAY